MSDVRFYYDLGSPYAFLTATRIDQAFDVDTPVEWIPVLLGAIFQSNGRMSWAETPKRDEGIFEVEQRAAAYGLPFLSWPEEWPNDGLTVMRVACWATENNAGRRFANAAFREQFVFGNPLSEEEHIRSAAKRADLDPDEAIESAKDPVIKAILRDNTDQAIAMKMIGVPSIAVAEELFWGDDRLGEAVALLS